jgi:hypothetical protein
MLLEVGGDNLSARLGSVVVGFGGAVCIAAHGAVGVERQIAA